MMATSKRRAAKRPAKRAAKKTTKRATVRAAAKLDLYAQHASEYVMPREPQFISVGRANYLAIEGKGPPATPAFTEAIGALYSVAYTIKMAHKFAGTEYKVTALEALWWVELPHTELLTTPRDRWHWQLLIRVPEFVTPGEVARAGASLAAKGKGDAVKHVRRISLTEGKCVQVLHVGGYDAEAPTIGRMRAHTELHGMRFRGMHHEIYLSNPGRVASDRLRTILRMPIGR